MEIWITLITVAGGIITTLITFLVRKYKENKKLQERENMLKELCNYAFGQIDMIIQDSIKVEPEVRQAMIKASKKYHSLDLVKEVKENEKNINKDNN